MMNQTEASSSKGLWLQT